MRPAAHALGVWLLVVLAETSKLNIPKVLLPFTRGSKINFTLEVTEGCYKWTSTRLEVASIEPVSIDDQQCSQRAVVQARATHPMRLTSIIFAEEIYTGQVLRCDAIVDIINDIRIVSTTRELYLEDSPLKLKIQALDSEGNTFSTLAGLGFEWTVVKDAEMDSFSDSHNTLRILKFMESTYVPPTYITEMEKVAKQGDTILVSGMKTGSAKLRAKILEPLYEKVSPAEVRLLILENILLNPASDVYLLVGSSIQYRVQKGKQGKITDVVMPSDQYTLQLQNHMAVSGGNDADPVAELDQRTSVVTALQQGQTNIVLRHKNLRMQGSSRLPNGTIFVVEPGYLGFTIHPGDRWALETERHYEITIDVYDKSSNKLYLSDNVRIEAKLPQEFFKVESSLNGSYHRVQTLKSGQTVIDAVLTSIVDQDGGVHMLSIPVRNQQEVEIYPPIKLLPKILTFPWQPKPGAYQYKVQVQGGSGNFTWSSSNNAVATVTVKGLVNTGHDIGVSVIRARDVQNRLHFGEMKVFVIEPSGMEFIACRVEAQVGNKLELPLRIFGLINGEDKEDVTLTDCTQFDLVFQMETPGVFTILDGRLPPSEDHCSGITVQAEVQGYTTIFVSYTHGRVHLKASIVVAAYLPLKAIDPLSVALVTFGSSKDMLFEGGPKPWVLEPLMFFRNASSEKPLHTKLSLLESRNHIQHSLRVLCRDLAEQVISLNVGNSPTKTNPFPAVEAVSVNMICAPPARFSLRPMYKHAYLDMACPLMQQNQQVIPVSNSQNQLLELVAYDHQGRRFDNFSSLSIEWHSSKDSLVSFHLTEPMELVSKEDQTGQRKLHGFITVHIHLASGTAVITAQAKEYKESHLSAADASTLYHRLAPISTSLDLLLVEDMKVNPHSISIYNHHLVTAEITISDGSGYFHINSTISNIIKTVYENQKGTIKVYPLQPGIVTVKVYDLCLVLPNPAEVRVNVSDIFQVDVTVVDKVEIEKMVKAYIRVLDSAKKPFLAQYLAHMNLELVSSSPIVSIKLLPDRVDSYTVVYAIHGEAVGLTSLTATATDKAGLAIDSAPRSLEVFPPFRLLPRKITLIIGAIMQVTSEGGPQPQSNIIFSVTNKSIASVDGNGFVEGVSIGNCTVTGVVQAVDTESGNIVVVSEDTVEVEVLQLRAIRIHAPITRMKTGTQMPVYVTGITSQQSPFSFGNAIPGLSFQWTVQKKDFLDIRSRHDEIFVSLPAWYNFAMNIYAKMKGKTGLKVTVRANTPNQFYGSVMELSDEIQIQVFERLHLTNPNVNAEQILMAPNSFLKLQTNRDQAAASVKYHVIGTPRTSAVVQVDNKGLLTAGSQTGISTIEINAQEFFGINQTFIISVKVSPISYIRIVSSPVLQIRDNHKLSTIPLGVTLTFSVQFHDCTGDLFHAQNSFLHLATNRDDLVQVGKGVANNTFTIQTVNVGLTIFHVWDIENPAISDYVPFPVEHSIFPSLTDITVGDVICFACSVNNQEGLAGVWTSSSTSVLQIDSKTGVALAKDVGFVTVYYEVPGLLRTYREAVIGSPQKMQTTEASAERINLKATNAHKFFIRIGEGSRNLKGECSAAQIEAISELHPEDILNCHLQFQEQKLDISPLDIFTAKPEFDAESGHYTCSITHHKLSESQMELLSTIDVHLTLSASLQGINFQTLQASSTVPVYAGFYANQKEIFLSNHHTKSELKIFGAAEILKYVEVKSGSSIVTVSLKERTLGKPSSLTYEIGVTDLRILSSESLSTFVTVSSSSFDQVIVVPVMVVSVAGPSKGFYSDEPGFYQDFTGSYQGIFFTMFALVATLALFFLVCFPRN